MNGYRSGAALSLVMSGYWAALNFSLILSTYHPGDGYALRWILCIGFLGAAIGLWTLRSWGPWVGLVLAGGLTCFSLILVPAFVGYEILSCAGASLGCYTGTWGVLALSGALILLLWKPLASNNALERMRGQ
jgi:hypothetical protein